MPAPPHETLRQSSGDLTDDHCSCLWFDGQAEEAARFYVSVFPNSAIDRVMTASLDSPGGTKAGEILFVEFTLNGQPFQALNGGPKFKFNEAISLSVPCRDQAEVDRLWGALTADGGQPVMCGWLKDKYGVSWQIVPQGLLDLTASSDREVARRAMAAMMTMVKIDLAAVEAAARG